MDQLFEVDASVPPENGFGFGGIAEKFARIRRAFEAVIDADVVFPVQADMMKSGL